MVTTVIEVTPSDIRQLQHELKDTAPMKMNPLHFRFDLFSDMVLIERKYAESLVELYKLNYEKHIPTKLEIIENKNQ